MTDLSLPPTAVLPLAAGLPPLAPIVARTALIDAIEQQSRRPAVRIGEALLALGLIDERALGDALQQQTQDRTRPLGELLVQRGLVSRNDLQAALAHRMGFPIVDALAFPVEPEAAARIPETLARRLPALPLLLRGDRLVVALEDPSARIVVDELEAAADCTIVPVLACIGSMPAALDRLYASAGHGSADAELGMALSARRIAGDARNITHDITHDSAHDTTHDTTHDSSADDALPDDEQVTQHLATLLREAHAAGASALHLECPEPPQPLRVRLRCGGRLRLAAELPAAWRAPLAARLKRLAGLDAAEQRRPQSGRADLQEVIAGQVLRLQVTTLPTADGLEDVVLRLSTPPRARTLHALGWPAPVLARFIAAIEQPQGLVLCAGPRGSGLTTVLHAALAHLNTAQRRLWTVEPALEIRQPGVRQLQINPHINPQINPPLTPRLGSSAAKALATLREADADVVMLDAPTDLDALREACALARTGTLVLAAVQADDAAQALAVLDATHAGIPTRCQHLQGTLTIAPGRPPVFTAAPASNGDDPASAGAAPTLFPSAA